jgi:hypothetical protein
MFALDFEKEKEYSEIARLALIKEQEFKHNNKKINILHEANEKLKKADFGKNLYRPYDELTFESKVTVDLLYYKHLLRNLDESYYKDVHELLAQTYRTVKDIYEFVNIEPEIFGRNIDKTILEQSIEKVEKKLSDVLTEVVNTSFYDLSAEKRAEKYSSRSLPLAKRLINENNNPEESLKFSIKTCVMEDILTKIAFPKSNWLRVKYLSESEDFGLIFDQQKLIGIVETFEKQINKMSKYLAACV